MTAVTDDLSRCVAEGHWPTGADGEHDPDEGPCEFADPASPPPAFPTPDTDDVDGAGLVFEPVDRPTWWVIEVRTDDVSEVELCLDVDHLHAVLADRAHLMAEARIVAVDPQELALLRLQTPVAAAPEQPKSRGIVTAEAASRWSTSQWRTYLAEHGITQAEAAAYLAERAGGATVGITDVLNSPDRALALLTLAAQTRRDQRNNT